MRGDPYLGYLRYSVDSYIGINMLGGLLLCMYRRSYAHALLVRASKPPQACTGWLPLLLCPLLAMPLDARTAASLVRLLVHTFDLPSGLHGNPTLASAALWLPPNLGVVGWGAVL